MIKYFFKIGFGTVEFEHPVEAVQAISMFNNISLYGRPMSIRTFFKFKFKN